MMHFSGFLAPYSIFFFNLLFQLIVITTFSTQLLCSILIIFFSQDICCIRSQSEKSDRQVFILFIMILNLGFCRFPPHNDGVNKWDPIWKGITNRHKYASHQDSSPKYRPSQGRRVISRFLEVPSSMVEKW